MAGLGTGAPIVKVYHAKSVIVPDVARVLACLYEKEINFKRETHPSYKSLLRLQASNHVPVPFYDGPTFLEESREICRYIAETYEYQGYPFLLGKDALERASIEQWLHHEEHAFNPPSRSLFCHLAFPVDEEDDDIDLQTRRLEEVLEVYEQRLGDSEFLAGNKFTLADLVHLPNSHHINESEFVYLYDSRKNVQRWWHAISTRESWQKVLAVMQEVEQQNKQEELDKQQKLKQEGLEKQLQRRWWRQHPPSSSRQIRLDPQEHISTKPQTILVPHPASIIAASPMAPQAEEPHPTETSSDEAPASSSPSIPTTHKPSDARSKHTTISTTHEITPPASVQTTPRIPEKSRIPVERRINFFTPATSPITAEKPSRTGADNSRFRDVSLPSEATDIDLPTKSKPSSSKNAPNSLHVFDEASRHTDEAEPYVEPTSQKPSEMLDEISETDGPSNAIDHAETGPRSAKEDSDRHRASGFWTDNTAPNADTKDKKSVRYTERTTQRLVEDVSSRSTGQTITHTSPEKPRSTEDHQKLQSEQWHTAKSGLSNLKGATDDSMPPQRAKPSKDVQHISPQDSEEASTHPLAQEAVNKDEQLAQGPERSTQTPYTDQRRDVSSRLWQRAADVQGFAEDRASTDHGGAGPPYAQKDSAEARRFPADGRKDASLPKRVGDDTQAIPLYEDDDTRTRETAPAPRRTRAQDQYDTSEGIGTHHSSSSRSQPVNAPHDAVPPPKQAASKGPYARKDAAEARRFPADRRKDAPLSKHPQDDTPAIPLYDDDDPNQEDRETAYAPRRTRAQDPYDTSEGTPSRSQPVNAPHDAVPPPKQVASEGPRRTSTQYPAAQEVFKQAGKSPTSRSIIPHDAQGSTESSSSKAHPSDSHLDEDGYGAITPLQTGYTGDPYNRKQDRGAAAPKRMMSQDVSEETKMTDSASFVAQTRDHRQADAPPQKQQPTEDPQTTASPSKKRYSDDEDAARASTDHGGAAVPPPKQVASEGPRRTSTQYPAAQEVFKQAGKSPTSRSIIPHDAQGSTESSSSKAHPSDPHLDEDGYGAITPLQTGYTGDPYNRKQDRGAAAPKRMMSQDVSEETKMTDSASFVAQTRDHRQADAPPQKQQPTEDPQTTASPSKKRYSDDEDAAKHDHQKLQSELWYAAKAGLSDLKGETDDLRHPTQQAKPTKDVQDNSPRPMAAQVQDNFEETKAGDSWSTRQRPSNTWRAPAPLQRHDEDDADSTTTPSQERYPGTGSTMKFASSRAQPVDYQRTGAPSRKQEAIEDPLGATSQVERKYADTKDTTKHSRATPSKPRKVVSQDAEDTSEEAEAGSKDVQHISSQDAEQANTRPLAQEPVGMDGQLVRGPERTIQTPYTDQRRDVSSMLWQRTADVHGIAEEDRASSDHGGAVRPPYARKDAAEARIDPADRRKDASFPKRVPDDTQAIPLYDNDDTNQEVRETASTPRRTTAPQDAVPPPKKAAQEIIKQASKSPASRLIVPHDAQGSTEEETKFVESASPRAQPVDYQRTDTPSRKIEAIEDPLGVTSPVERKYADGKETTKHSAFKPRKMVGQDAEDTSEEAEARNSPLFRRPSSPDAWSVAATPSKEAAAEDTLRVSQSSPTRYPRAEETSKQSRAPASIPTHRTAQDAKDVFREPKVADSTSFIEQPSDARAAGSFQKQEAPDARNIIAPLQKRYPDAKDTAKKPKVTFEESKISDSASSRGQPLDSERVDASSWKKEATDDPRATSAFKKRHSDVEDTTKQSRDSGFKPRQIVGQDAQGTYRETKASDPVLHREQSSGTWQAATTPIEKRATENDPNVTPPSKRSPSDEDTIKQPRGTASAPRRTTLHDANGTSQDSKPADSMSSREQPLSAWQPSRQEIEDSDSKTSAFAKTHPYVEDSNRQAGDTVFGPRQTGAEDTKDITEEKKVADSASSVRARPTYTPLTARPLSQQAEDEEDAHDKNREGRETASAPKKMVSRDAHDTYGERKTPHSTSTSPTPSKAQPADSRRSIKVERTPSVYEQPQTLPSGGRADGSTLKHQQDHVVPSISEEKLSTPPAAPRARVRDDHPTEEPFKGDIVDDQKGATPLLGQEPTSQVQRATELLHEAAPDGDMSSKLSTIDQWRHTSVPLQGITPNSGDDVLGGSTIDQRPTPVSEQSIPSARGANEMVKEEQGMVPPARTGAQTPDVQHAPSSFAGADMAVRDGEPVQMQGPTLHAHPTSVPTRRATPDARETSDQEFANESDAQRWNTLKAKHDLAMAKEDDQGAPKLESTQAQRPFDALRDPVSTQDVPSGALDKTKFAKPTSTEGMAPTLKAQLAEEKFAPSDKKLARAARPTSTKGMTPTAGPAPTLKAQLAEKRFAPSDKKSARVAQPLSSDQLEKPQTIFRQQARPSAPITKQVPSSDAHHDTRKIQQVTLDNFPNDDSPVPLVPSDEQVSHAPQITPSKNDRTPAPRTKKSAPSDQDSIQSAKQFSPSETRKEETIVAAAGSTLPTTVGKDSQGMRGAPTLEYEPAEDKRADAQIGRSDEVAIFEQKSGPSDRDSARSTQPTSSADPRDEELNYPSSAKPLSSARPDQTKDSTIGQQAPAPGISEYEPSFRQAQSSDTWPGSTATPLYAQPASDDEHARRFSRDQGPESTQSQSPFDAPRDSASTQDVPSDAMDITNFAKPTSTEGMKPSAGPEPTLKSQLDEEKFAPSDNKSAHAAQPFSSVEPRKEDTSFSAADQPEKAQTIFRQQPRPSAPIAKQVPSSDAHHDTRKIQQVTLDNLPTDDSPVPLFPSDEQASHAPQTIPSKMDMIPAPGTREFQASNAQIVPAKVQEAVPDNYHTDELTVPGSSTEPHEGTSSDAHDAADGKDITKYPSRQAPVYEDMPESAPADSNVRTTGGDGPGILPDHGTESPAAQATNSEDQRNSTSTDHVPANAMGNIKKLRPPSTEQETISSTPGEPSKLDVQSDSAVREVFPAVQKSAPSDQDSIQSAQHPPPAETRQEETIVAAAEPTLPTTVSKGMRGTPTLEYKPTEDKRADTQSARSDEVALSEQKSGLSDRDSARSTQPAFFAEPRDEELNYTSSAKPLLSAAPDQKKDSQTTIGQQAPAPGTSEYPPSGQGQVYRAKPDSEGPFLDSRSAVGEKTMRPPSSQAQSSDSKPDPTQNRGDEPSTRYLSNQEAKQHAETQPPPPLVHPYDTESTQDVTSDTLDKAKSLKPSSIDQEAATPDTHLRSAPGQVARPGQELLLKAQDSANPMEKSSSSEPTKDQATVAARNQAKPSEATAKVVIPADQSIAPSAQSSDVERDMLPSSVDVDPSSGEQSTTRLLRDQEAQPQLPATTKPPPPFEDPVYSKSSQDAPKSFKPPPSADMSPKVVPASAPATQFGEASDEITPDGQSSPLSAQDIARSAQRSFFVEPTKENGIVAASDQTNEARPTSDQRGITPTPDKQRTPDLRGAVDEKMPLPSSRPDSAPIGDDVHRTSGDDLARSSVLDSQAQPPAGTQNVPPSTDQEPMTPMTSPAPAPDALQGLREPASSDSTRPSEEIQESRPDAYFTKSDKPPLPIKDPVQPPHEASFGLLGDGKPTMVQGDQTKTTSDASLSASEAVGQSENNAVKGPLSAELKNLEKTSPEEKWNQQQQTDQSSTRPSKDGSIESSGTRNPNISKTSGAIQPSPLMESMQAIEGSRNQQQANRSVFQSKQDNKTQIEETEPQDTGSDEPKDSTQSTQLSPVRRDVANADQTDVSQGSLREPTSSDATHPTGKIQEFRPDDYLTNSEKPSVKGTDPVQPPEVTAFDLPSHQDHPPDIKSPRPPSTGQELMTPMASPAAAPDAPQDKDSTQYVQSSPSVVSRRDVGNAKQSDVSQEGLREPANSDTSTDAYLTNSEKPLISMKGTDPVQPPEETAFDLSSDGKPTMIKGDQANTISNASLSASLAVGQSESSAVGTPLSEKSVSSFPQNNLEEKLNQKQQTDQSSTRSFKDDSIEASGTASPNTLATSGDIQPSPLKESMQEPEGSRKQQQADRAVFQSKRDNKTQIEETETQDTGFDEPKEIRSDSAPISGDGPATGSVRDSQAPPPAGTQNVPTVFSEKISPRPLFTDPAPAMTPMTSSATAPDAPQDKDSTQSTQSSPSVVSRRDVANADQSNVLQAGREPASSDATRSDAYLTNSEKPLVPVKGTDPVQPPEVAAFDLPSDGKPTMIKGDQANTISNVSLSASPAVGQSESKEIRGPPSEERVSSFSEKKPERTSSPEEQSKHQQQRSGQPSTRSSEDDRVEASGTATGDIEPSALKQSTQAAEGSRNQQQPDRPDNEKTEAQDTTATDDPEERNGENVRMVQQQSNDTKNSSRLTKDAPSSIQAGSKTESSLRTPEEPKQQAPMEGETRGGETKVPAYETEQPEERDPASSNKGITSQSQSEASDKLEDRTSSAKQNRGTNSRKSDGSTDGTKYADTDDNNPSL